MTTKQAKRILVGTIVMWDGNLSDLGTVRAISYTGFLVDWENGLRGWIAFQDAQRVSIR